MSRLSYGGGMFSPLRCDTSLNDDVFKGQQESDIFSQWKDICVGEVLDKNNEDFPKEISDEKKDDSMFAVKPSDSLLANKYEKNLPTSSDSSKGKLSYVTTRRKNSTQNKQPPPENLPKSLTSAPKEVETNRKKDSLSKYVSVRSEVGKGSEFRPSKTRQSSNSYTTPSLPSLVEEQFGMKSPENAPASENKIRNVRSAQSDVKKLGNATDRKEKKANPLASFKGLTSNASEIRKDECLTSGCEVQTDLLMLELNSSSGKAIGDSVSLSYQTPSASNLPISCQPQQIQANIIERLVRDTVSFEFDGIRQMLYLQQLSLFKYIDKKFEEERDNSSLLKKCVESLVEENSKLRAEVTAYQNFFKV